MKALRLSFACSKLEMKFLATGSGEQLILFVKPFFMP
jgi:hypothetical protein